MLICFNKKIQVIKQFLLETLTLIIHFLIKKKKESFFSFVFNNLNIFIIQKKSHQISTVYLNKPFAFASMKISHFNTKNHYYLLLIQI